MGTAELDSHWIGNTWQARLTQQRQLRSPISLILARDLHKRDWASLVTCAGEAREMLPALEGGDARLLERLKRDLEKYTPEIGAI
jgi:hypothetical protein